MTPLDRAKQKRAEIDALKTEVVDLRVKRDKSDALMVELEKEKGKGKLPATIEAAMTEFKKPPKVKVIK